MFGLQNNKLYIKYNYRLIMIFTKKHNQDCICENCLEMDAIGIETEVEIREDY